MGTRLGAYEIVGPIGAGAMGEVYRARDTRLDREVAIKMLPASLAEDALALERFQREARLVASLNHPHICTLYDVGDQDGRPYLLMELLDGGTLQARLAQGALPIEQTIEWGIQIADALDAAHARGIVHRDLKPANIIISARGDAKVLDFGIANL
jgi:serine/threonine protein kinase